MADPGEGLNCHMCERSSGYFKSLDPQHDFLKYPQLNLAHELMKELNLCAHDHSFVPPW